MTDRGTRERNVGLLCPAGPEDVPPGVFAREAERLGFKHFLMPASNKQQQKKKNPGGGIKITGVQTVHDVVEQIFLP